MIANTRQCVICGSWIACKGVRRKELNAHIKKEHPEEWKASYLSYSILDQSKFPKED